MLSFVASEGDGAGERAGRPGQMLRRASMMSSVLASAAASSTFEMLGDDSLPCTRPTGASS